MDRARRACPVGNKQCHARFVKKCQEAHKKKLSEMKCSIDNTSPKSHPHLRKNLKKEQLLEERYAEIERDNRLLLEKMSYIMRHSSLPNDSQSYAHSLNREARKRELQRITRENQHILSRIQAAEPTYDHLAWAEHEKQHQEYMKNICELPVVIHDQDVYDDDDDDGDELLQPRP
ncbi:hypothetical protein CTAYLR_005710 [Chrysophaeum taylorii]|uniref:Uncharacterized protein n=1 Tax=Chrysophaeum taylorii TaxID=2483200 RepID=A0AAD7XHC4_9STRA|nr:hypothetical protein CTAYLR_005710 [Chrysophaeum taylorii]